MDISKDKILEPDMSMGLYMALAKNTNAFNYFYSLSEPAQKQIIDHSHAIESKEEMQTYVDSLVEGLS